MQAPDSVNTSFNTGFQPSTSSNQTVFAETPYQYPLFTSVTVPRRHLPFILSVLEHHQIPHCPDLNIPEIWGYVPLSDFPHHPRSDANILHQTVVSDSRHFFGEGTSLNTPSDNTTWHPQPVDSPPYHHMGDIHPTIPPDLTLLESQPCTTPYFPSPQPTYAQSIHSLTGLVLVPQQPYRPAAGTLEPLSPPLQFCKDGVQGVFVSELLSKDPPKLDGGDMQVFTNCAESVSIRINWRRLPKWTEQFSSFNHKKTRQHITLNKAAVQVARKIARFYEWVQRKQEQEGFTFPDSFEWKIGRGGIRLENLVLSALQHVSRGSWQPKIMIHAQRSAAITL